VDAPGDGTLIVVKNSPGNKYRGGFLIFNGRFIPLRDFLSSSQTVFEKGIRLSTGNRLFVFLRGAPGASLKIEIQKTSSIPPPEVTLSADPDSIRHGESSTLIWNSKNATSCVIAPGIGAVSVNGRISVTPAATTRYIITATGPAGTATDSVTVTVSSLDDIDYGLSLDEQRGGGGLVGETIRILNGNMVEFREDLNFASPHRSGLSFAATYNSKSDKHSSLGHGWSHTYSATLNAAYEVAGEIYLTIVDPTGRVFYFKEESAGIYKGQFHERTRVIAEAGGYVWHRLDGFRYGYSDSGTLLWLEDESENRLELVYDAQNRLDSVADHAGGRELTLNYNSSGLIESISGPITPAVPSGIWASYGYDENENLVTVSYADGSGFVYGYDDPQDTHNLTEQKNTAGHLLNTWAYDAQDRCIENYSVNGTGVTVDYGAEKEIKVTDAYRAMRIYTTEEISGRKRLSSMTGPGGAPYNNSYIVRWEYDNHMNLNGVETAVGTIQRYLDYDDRGNPATVIHAAGTPQQRVITFTFHPEINVPLTRSEDSVLGNGEKATIWDYDNDYDAIPNEDPTGRISRIIEQGFTQDAAGAVTPYEHITTLTYNTKGLVLTIDGPLIGKDDITTFAYDDDSADLLTVIRPLIGATGFSDYNTAGQVGRVKDVNGQSKEFTYDGRGRITATIHQADNSRKTISYNLSGSVAVNTDEDGVSRYFDYDGVTGRLIRRSDMEGNYITYQYDAQGNRIEMSKYDVDDNRNSRKRWSYQQPDIPGKLWKEIKADGTIKEYGYDFEGNIAAVTDFEGHPTFYEYDTLNRLVKVVQPGNGTTSYDYDNHGNLVSVTDAENHETTFVYDDMARMVSTSSPDSGTAIYVYDAAGNLVTKTDAGSITVQYEHDLLNRLTAVWFPDSGQDILYGYDGGINGIGRRTSITDPSGIIDFEYNVHRADPLTIPVLLPVKSRE
jgi:YD repeat-containing protein